MVEQAELSRPETAKKIQTVDPARSQMGPGAGASRVRAGRIEKANEELERAMGFEPTTPTLARLCSTPELHPHPREVRTAAAASQSYAKERRAWQPPPPRPMKPPTEAADARLPRRAFRLSG